MSLRIRLFLFLSGGWIFFSWGFRLYILSVRWETDSSRGATLLLAMIFLAIGGFLIFMGRLGERAAKRHFAILTVASLFMIGFWTVRIVRYAFSQTVDPNPRAHLHLAATFLVVSLLLLLLGLTRLRRPPRQPG